MLVTAQCWLKLQGNCAALLQYLASEYKVLRGVKNTVPEVADATPHKQAVPDLQVTQLG